MRSRALAFGCLLIGGALALIGSGQPWWRAAGDGVVLKFSGTQATGGLSQALAVVALAGTVLMLALRTRGRRIIGALLVLVGAGLAVVGGLGLRPSADAIGSSVNEVTLADTLSATVWPWIFLGSGVLITIGAVLTIITAGTWRSRSDRFRPGSGRSEDPDSGDPTELWKAMDAGVDPTTNASTDTAMVPYPNVHNRDPGDTMDDTEGRRTSPEREE
ncbi:MAG TPA: Trp biosynthesis-associated membrane protein [Propionibacteriaceae bacterium]|nr:Trp biosynthesis-associated membrane protein [Propionibacteriaceae bacterium]